MFAAVVLTLNEEPRIETCLKHLRPYFQFLLVLDGESNDRTVELAKPIADKVITQKPSRDFASIRNLAWSHVPRDAEWVLFADADERFHRAFLEHISELVERHGDALAFGFPRIKLPDAEGFPDWQIRFLRNNGLVEWRGRVHEVPFHRILNKQISLVPDACVGLLNAPIIHLAQRENVRRWWY